MISIGLGGEVFETSKDYVVNVCCLTEVDLQDSGITETARAYNKLQGLRMGRSLLCFFAPDYQEPISGTRMSTKNKTRIGRTIASVNTTARDDRRSRRA